MSSPFPSELVAAAQGSRVAWVFDAKGVRNVWVADGPDFAHTARQLTHYTADDGQPIASLRLTPDGKTAFYALGSELNDAQESANPESWTKGAKQQVFALDVDAKDKGAAPGCWATWDARMKAVKTLRFRLTASGRCGPRKRSCGWLVLMANSKPRSWLRCGERPLSRNGRPTANTSLSSASVKVIAYCHLRLRWRLDSLSGAERGQGFHAALVARWKMDCLCADRRR